MASFSHETIEKNVGLMIVLVAIVVSIAGLVQLVPLFFDKSTTQPIPASSPTPPCSSKVATCIWPRAATSVTRR
jgi:Cbb3-type cytochrome oxidase, cytochrome c subunit